LRQAEAKAEEQKASALAREAELEELAAMAAAVEAELVAQQHAEVMALVGSEAASRRKRELQLSRSRRAADAASSRVAEAEERAAQASQDAALVYQTAQELSDAAASADSDAMRAEKMAQAAEIVAGDAAPAAYEGSAPGRKRTHRRMTAAELKKQAEEDAAQRQKKAEEDAMRRRKVLEAEHAAKNAEKEARRLLAESKRAEKEKDAAEKEAREADLAARREAFFAKKAAEKAEKDAEAAARKPRIPKTKADALAGKAHRVVLAIRKGSSSDVPLHLVATSPRRLAAAEESARDTHKALAQLGIALAEPLAPLREHRSMVPSKDLRHSAGLTQSSYGPTEFTKIQASAERWAQPVPAPQLPSTKKELPRPKALAAPGGSLLLRRIRAVASTGALPSIRERAGPPVQHGNAGGFSPKATLVSPRATLDRSGRLRPSPSDQRHRLPPTELGMRVSAMRERSSFLGSTEGVSKRASLNETVSAPLLMQPGSHRRNSPAKQR